MRVIFAIIRFDCPETEGEKLGNIKKPITEYIQERRTVIMKMRKFLAIALAMAIIFGTMSFPVFAENEMTFSEFIAVMQSNNYKYDFQGATVRLTTDKFCVDSAHGSESDCTYTKGTDADAVPQRIQGTNAQYQLFSGAKTVKIENVKFVADKSKGVGLHLTNNNGWQGEIDGNFNVEFQFQNTSNLVLNNCSFDGINVAPYHQGIDTKKTNKDEFSNCSFENVYNAYGIQGAYAGNVIVSGCTFKNCTGGIYIAAGGTNGILINNNTFENMGENCPDEKIDSKGLVQLSAATPTNAPVTIANNTSDGSTPVLRQLSGVTKIATANNSFGSSTDITTVTEEGSTTLPTVVNPVAEVNGVPYATLPAAIYGIKSGETVKLVDNIHVGFEDMTDYGSAGYTWLVISGKSLTMDLNGHTIDFNDDVKRNGANFIQFISVAYGSDVTVTGNGVIDVDLSTNTDAYIFYVIKNDGYGESKLTIENGTFRGAPCVVKNIGNNVITVKGGTYDITNHCKSTYPNQIKGVLNSKGAGNMSIQMEGGTVVGNDPRHFDDGSLVKSGYTVKKTGENYTVVPENTCIAVLNTKYKNYSSNQTNPNDYTYIDESYYYETYADAIANAQDGDTVTLLAGARGMTVKVEKANDKVVAGEEFTVKVVLNSEAIAHVEYTLEYDSTKFAPVNGNNTGKITFTQDSGTSAYEDGKVLAEYKFKALAQTEETTGEFKLTSATTSTFAEALEGTKVDVAKITNATVTISMEAFNVKVKVDGEEVDGNSKTINYDGNTHSVSFDVTPTSYKKITTTIKLDGTDVNTIKKPGTYEIEYTVESLDGYNNYTGRFTLTILPANAYFTEVNLSSGKNADYVAGKKLVLAYTDLDDVGFKYNKVDMIEVTKVIGNYQYEGTETTKKNFKHVYAYVTDAISNGTLASYKANITPFVIEEGYAIKKIDEYTFDINNSVGLDNLDPTTAMGIYGGVSVYYGNSAAQINILKADVNGDKKVDADDTTRVTLAVYGK